MPTNEEFVLWTAPMPYDNDEYFKYGNSHCWSIGDDETLMSLISGRDVKLIFPQKNNNVKQFPLYSTDDQYSYTCESLKQFDELFQDSTNNIIYFSETPPEAEILSISQFKNKKTYFFSKLSHIFFSKLSHIANDSYPDLKNIGYYKYFIADRLYIQLPENNEDPGTHVPLEINKKAVMKEIPAAWCNPCIIKIKLSNSKLEVLSEYSHNKISPNITLSRLLKASSRIILHPYFPDSIGDNLDFINRIGKKITENKTLIQRIFYHTDKYGTSAQEWLPFKALDRLDGTFRISGFGKNISFNWTPNNELTKVEKWYANHWLAKWAEDEDISINIDARKICPFVIPRLEPYPVIPEPRSGALKEFLESPKNYGESNIDTDKFFTDGEHGHYFKFNEFSERHAASKLKIHSQVQIQLSEIPPSSLQAVLNKKASNSIVYDLVQSSVAPYCNIYRDLLKLANRDEEIVGLTSGWTYDWRKLFATLNYDGKITFQQFGGELGTFELGKTKLGSSLSSDSKEDTWYEALEPIPY